MQKVLTEEGNSRNAEVFKKMFCLWLTYIYISNQSEERESEGRDTGFFIYKFLKLMEI